jgi:biofilm PGA synthesis N-glycosyltransferase PgaC
VVITVVFILYFLLLIAFLGGWKKAVREPDDPVPVKEPLISIVIPARNEELTIAKLLHDLSCQEYKNFEVIVVNDDSEDETLWMASSAGLKNVQVVHNKGRGKKAAIATGIKLARGTIIVTTDADCSIGPQWLTQVRAGFRNQKIMMVFGGVRMEGAGSFFDALQSMEFSSLIGTGAATVALGFPTTCNGANLAFRKKVFSEVKGYEGNLYIPSGDDEFLMRKIEARYPGSIRFLYHEDAVVSTQTQQDPDAFLNQRIRWASKWRFNSSWAARTLAVVIALIQLIFIINWALIFSSYILQSLFLLTVKMILEAAFLLQVCRFLRTPWNWLAFFSLQIIYPLYVLTVAVHSFFVPFQWKNRIFKPY